MCLCVCVCNCVNAGNYFRPMSLGQLTFLLNYLNTLFQLAYQKKHQHFDFILLVRLLFRSSFHSFIVHIKHSFSIMSIWCEAYQQMLRFLYHYTLFATQTHAHTSKRSEREKVLYRSTKAHSLSSPFTIFSLCHWQNNKYNA